MQLLYSLITLDKSSKQPVYLQATNQLMDLIKKGALQGGQQLPSSRILAGQLNIHRRTVVRAYDELLAQGWLESRLGSGTFVANHFPEAIPEKFINQNLTNENSRKTSGFDFEERQHLNRAVIKCTTRLHLDDGFPDPRLAPLEELSRAYRTQLLTGNSYIRLGYGETAGSLWLRQELSNYLNETRGLTTTHENILITRGTVMGLYLASTGLLKKGDTVVTGELCWSSARINFIQAGAEVLKIPVDSFGIDVEALENICKSRTIRMVYITSHHHYPTTVALRADRRIRLLTLSEKYGFIIFEDDYDYDFHYLSKPLLPLASADTNGMVLYCGSFTKTISPAFRVGYLVGSENAVRYLAKLRRIIDRQGDTMLENAMADLLQNGIIQRHLRKSLRTYRQRRDVFCDLLNTYLSPYIDFQKPHGGMAVWTQFNPSVNISALAEKAFQNDLFLADGTENNAPTQVPNAVRLGFASSTTEELEQCVEIMKKILSR
jgi:GntR family transcriptional regulator/MocR family aminotransferase